MLEDGCYLVVQEALLEMQEEEEKLQLQVLLEQQQQLDEDHDGDGEGEEAQLVSPLSTYPLVFIHILLNNTCHCQMWSSCLL